MIFPNWGYGEDFDISVTYLATHERTRSAQT